MRRVASVMDGAAEAAFHKDARRDVDGPGQARIGEAGAIVEVQAAADMRPGNEIAGEKVRCGERLIEKDFAGQVGRSVASFTAPRILSRQSKTEFRQDAWLICRLGSVGRSLEIGAQSACRSHKQDQKTQA